MKPGGENRKKMIAAGGLGTAALICLAYAYNQLFGGPTNPAATAPPASSSVTAAPSATASTATSSRGSTSSTNGSTAPSVVIPGVAARKIATSSGALDPTLDQTSMLRTENLVYAGAGRNIFSATYTPPTPPIPKNVPPPRPATPPVYTPPVPTGPPPPPPINLKFFGTATRSNGLRQAFLLQGEDVYLASPGDIVARKYKIGTITQNSVQVTDLQNNNTQTLSQQ